MNEEFIIVVQYINTDTNSSLVRFSIEEDGTTLTGLFNRYDI